MAHALLNYDGDCRNIHGHSYELHITILGTPTQQKGHSKDGMVMDFRDLKALVKKEIINPYDHALVLNEHTPAELIESFKKFNQKTVLTPFQPTCENLLLEFVDRIQNALPFSVKLYSVKLHETNTSYAEWNRTLAPY